MNSPLAPEDETLLQRYREQGTAQPPAAMDARILAAARQAVAPRRLSVLTRLGHWLTRASLAQRSSLAFGSLASAALALGLVWQSVQLPAPEGFGDRVVSVAAPAPPAPSASASALVELSREMRERRSPAPRAAAPMEAMSAKPAPSAARSVAPMDESTADAERPAVKALDVGLREVLQLRAEGRDAAATLRLQQLGEQYPGAALQQRLDELRRETQAEPAR